MSQPTSSRSSLAEALSGWPPPVLDPHGPFSNTVTTLAWVLIALVTLIFVLVCAAVWVALYGSDELRAKLGGEGVVKWFGLIVPAGVLFLLLGARGLWQCRLEIDRPRWGPWRRGLAHRLVSSR